MNFKEVQRLLKMMNVDMNEDHALRLFQVHTTPAGLGGLEQAAQPPCRRRSSSIPSFLDPSQIPPSLPPLGCVGRCHHCWWCGVPVPSAGTG